MKENVEQSLNSMNQTNTQIYSIPHSITTSSTLSASTAISQFTQTTITNNTTLSSSLPNDDPSFSSNLSSNLLSSSLPVANTSLESMMDSHDMNCAASLYASSPDLSYQQYNANRHYARNTLLAVGGKASALINRTTMMRFSLNTVSKLVPGSARNYTMQQWHAYGDPILDRLDATIDEAVNAISIASAVRNQSPSSSYIETTNLPSSFSEYRQSSDAIEPSNDNFIPEKDIDQELENKTMQTYLTENDSNNNENALVTVPTEDSGSLYVLYWERLKQKFVNSHWYSKVDSILLQNYVVRAFTDRMVRPAEVFYNTVTEEFVSHATQEDFLEALKARVGPAWDDRLAPLAKGFYTTAKTVSAVVGAGKFVGGALQLGKARVNRAIEDILQQWDRVLGITDEFVDRLLPVLPEDTERELMHVTESRLLQATQSDELTDGDTDLDDSDDISLGSSESDSESLSIQRNIKKRSCEHLSQYDRDSDEENEEIKSDNDNDDNDHETEDTSDANLPAISENFDHAKHPRTSRDIVYKFGKRLRQRMPSFSSIPSVRNVSDNVSNYSTDLKQKLIDNAWFATVDDILLQNAFVRAVASFMRPAEHFYNTALALFNSPKFSEQVALALPTLIATIEEVEEEEEEDIDLDNINTDPVHSSTPITILSTSSELTSSPMIESDTSATSSIIQTETSPKSSSPLLPLPSVQSQRRTRSSSPPSNRIIQSIDLDSPGFQPIVGEFVGTMRSYLGDSWDVRLEPMARSFLQAAITIAPKSIA